MKKIKLYDYQQKMLEEIINVLTTKKITRYRKKKGYEEGNSVIVQMPTGTGKTYVMASVSDKNARSFYEQEAQNSNWSVRELKRQINTSLFERLLLSDGNSNKEKVLALASQGMQYSKPSDILKDPYVFEFLGIPENKPMLEKDLEKALIVKIEKFLLELGRGFMFVGSQQRITLGNTHYYVCELLC